MAGTQEKRRRHWSKKITPLFASRLDLAFSPVLLKLLLFPPPLRIDSSADLGFHGESRVCVGCVCVGPISPPLFSPRTAHTA